MSEDSANQLMLVKLVVALPQKQVVKDVELRKGATVRDAIKQSGIEDLFSELRIDPKMVGIFGVKVSIDQEVQDGDRVEIYRPLVADPKETRRQRALRQAEVND